MDLVSACCQTENGIAMSGYSHLSRWESGQIVAMQAAGRSVRVIAPARGRGGGVIIDGFRSVSVGMWANSYTRSATLTRA